MTSQIPEQMAARGYRYKHGDRPLDGYTIQQAAGRGGFGEVYFAVSDSGREVALKVVNAFEQIEMRGISQCMNLKSPHLVSIFDVREGDDGQPIVIMEYVGGPSLRELLDQSPAGLGAAKAAFFLREIAKGVSQLHDCGIVHRDIKPANIFYENGYVKIGDYGLSKAISASHRSGQTVTVGTVHYMAPEVGAGCYDRSIDIYAMGALLYEMLTGRPPFHGGSTAEVLMKHLATEVDVKAVPEPFGAVITRAMLKDPAKRYATVQEMVEAVFGAEDVRQSVSCFSPDALTLVAGRVANRAGIANAGGRPLSSRPFATNADAAADPHAKPDWAVRAGAGIDRLSRAVAGVGGGLASLVHRPRAADAGREPPPLMNDDPLPARHRSVLVLLAIVMVAVVAGVVSPSIDARADTPVGIFLALLMTAGGTLGISLTARKFLPALHSESRLVRHFAFGAIGSTFAVGLSLPAWAALASNGSSIAPVGAICVAMFLIDWDRRTRRDRPDRLALKSLIVCVVLGLVLGGLIEARSEAVAIIIEVLCGISIASQLAAPWSPTHAQRRWRLNRVSRPPVPAPAAPALANPPVVPPTDSESTQMNANTLSPPLPGLLATPTSDRTADHTPAILGTLVRIPFVLLGAALLLCALMLACGLALDLPGLIESGRLDPQMPRELRREFGNAQWPQAMRLGIGAALFTCQVSGCVIWMLARRRHGGVHMARVAAGSLFLVASPFMMLGRHIYWTPVFHGEDFSFPSVLGELLQQIHVPSLVLGALVFLAAWVVLLWPAHRRNQKPQTA